MFFKSLRKVSQNPERVKLLSQGVLSRVFGTLENVLGKTAKVLKNLIYYPYEFSVEPLEVWQKP